MRRKRAQRKNGCFRCVRFLRNGSRGAGRLEKKWSRSVLLVQCRGRHLIPSNQGGCARSSEPTKYQCFRRTVDGDRLIICRHLADSTSSTNGTLQDTRMKLRRTRRQVNPGPPYQYHLVFQTGRHNDESGGYRTHANRSGIPPQM